MHKYIAETPTFKQTSLDEIKLTSVTGNVSAESTTTSAKSPDLDEFVGQFVQKIMADALARASLERASQCAPLPRSKRTRILKKTKRGFMKVVLSVVKEAVSKAVRVIFGESCLPFLSLDAKKRKPVLSLRSIKRNAKARITIERQFLRICPKFILVEKPKKRTRAVARIEHKTTFRRCIPKFQFVGPMPKKVRPAPAKAKISMERRFRRCVPRFPLIEKQWKLGEVNAKITVERRFKRCAAYFRLIEKQWKLGEVSSQISHTTTFRRCIPNFNKFAEPAWKAPEGKTKIVLEKKLNLCEPDFKFVGN